MAKHGHVPHSYFAFDTFEGHANYNAISQLAPWSIEDKEHTFSAEHTDFLFVWETAVKDIYPEAQGRKGSSSKNTINYHTHGSIICLSALAYFRDHNNASHSNLDFK